MKDSEFIELLNLYLDHEITAADAARLEAEVQGNPARHRVYQDYCRMQKACKMLATDFAAEPATAEPNRPVVPFTVNEAARPSRTPLWYVGGALAAAACAAVIFVTRSHRTDAGATVASVPPAVAPATAVAVTTPTPSARGIERRSMSELSLRNAAQSQALLAAAANQNDPNFAWLQQVRLVPIQPPVAPDALRLQAPVLRPENKTFNSPNKPSPSDVESIAIRFQR